MSAVEERPEAAELVPDLPEDANVVVIGLGGVGGIVARQLAVFLAARDRGARLVLVDGDEYEPHNGARMSFHRFGNKAEVVLEELQERFASSRLSLVSVPEFVRPDNVAQLVRAGSIVLLCVDNSATRKLVAEHAATLEDLCLISGGNDGIGRDAHGRVRRGTFGTVQAHVRTAGRDRTPPLDRHHAEIREPRDVLPGERGCDAALYSTPQILFANVQTAAAMLNTFLLHVAGELHYGELCFDIALGRMQPVQLPGVELGARRERCVESM